MISNTGLSPAMAQLPSCFFYHVRILDERPYNPGSSKVAGFGLIPRSLAATKRISFDFFSSGY